MKRLLLLSTVFLLVAMSATHAIANETTNLLREAIELIEKNEYREAREVIAIALDQVDHHLLDAGAEVFPVTVGVFTRGDVSTQKSMGIDLTECTYTDADGNTIRVQVMGGGGGVLGNISSLTASFGGGRKVRLHGRNGTVMEEGKKTTLTLQLKNEKSLIMESDGVDREGIMGFGEKFPVVELDESGS